MATKPFEPKGDVARWVPVYERLRDMAIGEIITYSELSELAGIDIQQDRGPYVRAAKELLEKNQRAMKNIPEEGYAVAHPSEQGELARGQTRKASRRLTAAIRLVGNTDANYLTPDQRLVNDRRHEALTAQSDMLRRLARRTTRLEEGLEKAREETRAARRESKETTAGLAEEVARQGEVLERLRATLMGRSETSSS
jgi:hypothetical protein